MNTGLTQINYKSTSWICLLFSNVFISILVTFEIKIKSHHSAISESCGWFIRELSLQTDLRGKYFERTFILVADTHLKGEEGHYNSHPADCHRDVCSPLLSDDVNGAKEENRPDDVVEDDKAQEGHQDPQWDTHHL